MGDETNDANELDEQDTIESDGSDEKRDVASGGRVERAHGTSVAPVDDDVIIK